VVEDMALAGQGALLALLEARKAALKAEGLFDRKRPLPFLPRRVGLVCGARARAKDDVLVNARDRWPEVAFEIREVAVQGPSCVGQVVRALADLDAHPEVDVVVVTRGGGAVEDLLPFSNEAMIRAAAACRTPIVSAIGHETDSPLLDLVADLRASTPTDAAKRVVPDVVRERAQLTAVRQRLHGLVEQRVATEQHRLDAVRSRPVLVDPTTVLEPHRARVAALREAGARVFARRVDAAVADVTTLRTALRTLSPQATLDRGYAVLRTADGEVVRSAEQVAVGADLRALLAAGRLDVTVSRTDPGRDDAAPVVGSSS
jgi:exodeoxyribonuclease VII large subunit